MTTGLVNVTYDWSEVLEWAKDLELYETQWFPRAMQDAVLEAGLFFEREAKENAPVDTGRLRASIGHGPAGIWEEGGGKGKGYWIDVGTNVEYAPYMEFGFTMATGHVAYIKAAGGFRYVHPFTFKGYHYMQKAATSTERIIGFIVEKHLGMAIEKAGL